MGVNNRTAGRIARLVAAGGAACAVLVMYARWGRPRLLAWGATAEEVSRAWMTVELLEPNRTLVLRENFELPSGHSFDPQSGPKSRVYLDGIWGFYLQPAPGGKTRLVAHTRGRTSQQPFMGLFSLLLGEPLHFIMQTRQFHGLSTRVGTQL